MSNDRPLPVFTMPACSKRPKHFFGGHRWWCRYCDAEAESQFKECAEALWKLQRAEDN